MPALPDRANGQQMLSHANTAGRDVPAQKGGSVGSSAALIIAPQDWSDFGRFESEVLRQICEKELRKFAEGDAIFPARRGVQPIAPAHESFEGLAALFPEQRRSFDKIAAVADQIPI